MISMKKYFALVGKTVQYRPATNLIFDVVIRDVSLAYGSVKYEVSPLAGRGSCWVDETSLHGLFGLLAGGSSSTTDHLRSIA